jgi:hypothetical protein
MFRVCSALLLGMPGLEYCHTPLSWEQWEWWHSLRMLFRLLFYGLIVRNIVRVSHRLQQGFGAVIIVFAAAISGASRRKSVHHAAHRVVRGKRSRVGESSRVTIRLSTQISSGTYGFYLQTGFGAGPSKSKALVRSFDFLSRSPRHSSPKRTSISFRMAVES